MTAVIAKASRIPSNIHTSDRTSFIPLEAANRFDFIFILFDVCYSASELFVVSSRSCSLFRCEYA